jgi:hypothetical protein
MAEQMRPLSKEQAPDPANTYERSNPDREAGMGRLDNNKGTPTNRPDGVEGAVTNKQQSDRQINAQDVVDQRASQTGADQGSAHPDHSMFEEELTDADLAPQDIADPQRKRNPRIGGKGGTPNVGESTREG